MDVPRKGAARSRLIKRIITGVITVAVVTGVTLWLNTLKPAAPEVERGTLSFDQVKRGLMLRQVRGLGTLVPEEILQIPAVTEGRVEKIVLRPGVNVKPDTILLEMSNPTLELEAVDLDWQVKAAEANFKDL